MALVLWKQNAPFDTLNLPNGIFFRQNGSYFDRNLQAISYDPTAYISASSPTVKVGKVAVGAPGSMPSVVNSGTTKDAVLDFTIPQGAGAPSSFWGVNGHITWTWTPNAQGYLKANWANACLRMMELGIRTYRNAYAWTEDASGAITGSDGATFLDFINNFAAPCGIQVHPVLMATYSHPSLTSETLAYNFGFARGVEAATKLRGLVPWYELGNELEVWGLTSGQGNWWQDYVNAKFVIQRGMLCGMRDGIKSVDTVTPIMSPGGTWMHTGFYDNLLLGRGPDGSTGNMKLDWDITSWHHYLNNYVPNDDLEVMSGQGGFNLLAKLASWGKPIAITECGVISSKYSNDETQIRQALTGQYMLQRYWDVRKTYNIIHVSPYQLFDAASAGVTGDEMAYGFMANDGVTKKARYTDMQNFVKLHQSV